MGVHKGQCPRITGRKQCRGTLFPASITEKKSVGVHSFWPVNIGKRRVQGYTLSCQLIMGREECRGTLFLSSISNSRESNSVGVHSFLPVNKQAEIILERKSVPLHSSLPAYNRQERVYPHTIALPSLINTGKKECTPTLFSAHY